MTRMSKQGKRRAMFPRRRLPPFPKTGPKRDHLEFGYKQHANAAQVEARFIPKIGAR